MQVRIHPRHLGRALAVAGATMLGIGMLAPVSADPPGNNGTIKVDGVAFDSHSDNEPHVSCTFQVDFYGYEAEVPVSMEFAVQPPTGDEVIRHVNGVLDDDDASGGGSEEGIDGQFTIDLTGNLAGFTPHPNQGYHVKLTITADDGTTQGNDTKSKVFWVGPCVIPTTTTTTTVGSTTTTVGATTTTVAATTTVAPTTTVAATTLAPTTTAGANVQGITVERKPAEVLGVELPRTGFSAVLLVVGFATLCLGGLFEALAQVARRRSTVS